MPVNRRLALASVLTLGLLAAAPVLHAAESPLVEALDAAGARGFARLLGATGRADALASRPFTLLAPLDSALPAAKVEELLKPGNAAAATKFVDGHVIAQALEDRDIKRRRSWTTEDGGSVAVVLERGKLTLGGARVAGEAKRVAGGYVYRLEQPLAPAR
jgi:uncharacterized surface protein with fasciclin (FAS1) repeats